MTERWLISPIYSEHGMCANDGSIPIIAGDDAEAGPIANVLPTVPFKRGQGYKLTDDPKRDAHARLIAAAPDLLGELRRMVDHFGEWAKDHSGEATAETWAALHQARAIIAKATPPSDAARSGAEGQSPVANNNTALSREAASE